MTNVAKGARTSRSRREGGVAEEGRIPSGHRGADHNRQAQLLTLKAAWMIDHRGNKAARAEIAMIKVATASMACRVIDWVIQAFGGAGVTGDYGLVYAHEYARVLRLADGPGEVHGNQIAWLEMRKYQSPASLTGGSAEVFPPDTSPGLCAPSVRIA
jgi:Acyl-CoA dehydrogenase, C-terminal domain